MEVSRIITEIENEIARLQEARALLLGGEGKKRGRPAGAARAAAGTTGRRTMSAAGRRRIAEAMKKRWAERKKQAGAK